MRIWTHFSAKKSKKMCLIGTRSELGQAQKGAIQHFESAD